MSISGTIQNLGVKRAKSAWGVGFVKQPQRFLAFPIQLADI
jgi:hypothetical protein